MTKYNFDRIYAYTATAQACALLRVLEAVLYGAPERALEQAKLFQNYVQNGQLPSLDPDDENDACAVHAAAYVDFVHSDEIEDQEEEDETTGHYGPEEGLE